MILLILAVIVAIIINVVMKNYTGNVILAALLFMLYMRGKSTYTNTKPESIAPVLTNTQQKEPYKDKSDVDFDTLLTKENLQEDINDSEKIVGTSYKGAIDYINSESLDYGLNNNKTTQYGEDKITAYQLKHRGTNVERQLAGGYNTPKIMKHMLDEELHNEEYSIWWGNMDK